MLNWSCCTQRIYTLHFNKIQPQDFHKTFLILNCTDIRPMMQLEVSTGQRQFCKKILHVCVPSLCSILLCQNGELILPFTLVIPDLIGSVLLKSSFFLAILLLFQVISWKRSHSGVEERPQVRRAYEVTTSTCDANVKNTFLLMACLQCMIGVTQKLATFEDCCQRLQPIPFFYDLLGIPSTFTNQFIILKGTKCCWTNKKNQLEIFCFCRPTRRHATIPCSMTCKEVAGNLWEFFSVEATSYHAYKGRRSSQ